MAPRKRSSMYVDGHSYSLFDPEEIHRDLRLDPVRARTVMARSKQVVAAHEFCQDCKDIAREQAAVETGGYESLDAAIQAHSPRETQFVITRANLARMLQIGPGERISRYHVDPDTQMLHVIIAGDHFQPAPDGFPVPVTRMSRVEPSSAGDQAPPA
jgi:hypothetical protein